MQIRNVAVLVSGGGSNLQAVMDAIEERNIPARISVVISNKPGVYALERAAKAGIPTRVITRKEFDTKDEFDIAIHNTLKEFEAEFIVLAGYLQIVGEGTIKEYKNKIINIHPSLIPSFCGMGFYGHKVHQGVLDYGAKVSGATVHFVDETADTGPIIIQETVPVLDTDDADTLASRILKVEHKILPKAFELLVTDRLLVDGRRVKIL